MMTKKQKKILLAVDGSENSKRAVLEAKNYGQLFDVEITLLTVLIPIANQYYTYLAPPMLEEPHQSKEIGEFVLKEASKLLALPKEQVHPKIEYGNPADVILREAELADYDLIILGSRGLGLFSRSFLGSVSNKVLHHTDKNVLIVK